MIDRLLDNISQGFISIGASRITGTILWLTYTWVVWMVFGIAMTWILGAKYYYFLLPWR